MAPPPSKQRILELARDCGFLLAGIAPAEPLERDHAAWKEWIADDRHAGMLYMARHAAIRRDPRELWPPTRSILMLGMPYRTDSPENYDPATQGRISCYAWGRDYHRVLRQRARLLLRRLRDEHDCQPLARICVDSAPLFERTLAARAGLGWIGKNTLLIHPRHGSWFFLAAILWDLELQPDQPMREHCGRCRACLDACPTGAFPRAHLLDARRCISYHTIEHRGPIAPAIQPDIPPWLFGCDVCQDACPFNRRPTLSNNPDFQLRETLRELRLNDFERMSDADYEPLLRGSALRRAGADGLRRNADLLRQQAARD